MKKKIAIFLSGAGSNASVIINNSWSSDIYEVALLVSDNPESRAKYISSCHAIPFYEFSGNNVGLLGQLKEHGIDFIVLAGFLKKIHPIVIDKYLNRIVNIHPSLLPRHGGKGMYGMRVHEAVVASGHYEDFTTGVTIHYVNHEYDEGQIIEQYKCEVKLSDTPEDVQKRVQILEHACYAPCIERLLVNLK